MSKSGTEISRMTEIKSFETCIPSEPYSDATAQTRAVATSNKSSLPLLLRTTLRRAAPIVNSPEMRALGLALSIWGIVYPIWELIRLILRYSASGAGWDNTLAVELPMILGSGALAVGFLVWLYLRNETRG